MRTSHQPMAKGGKDYHNPGEKNKLGKKKTTGKKKKKLGKKSELCK